MNFNSIAFVAAFPVFCAFFFATPARHQPAVLLVGSLAACATAGGTSLAWLIVITLFGYVLGRAIARSRSSARLAASIAIVITPLVVLKYTNFAMTSLRDAVAWAGAGVLAIPHFDATIPIGLSFYTFVVVGYLVDIHLERIEPETRLDRFGILTAFFPRFVSGPVERAPTFLPQLESAKRFDYARVTDGVRLMGWGLFKKVVVADRLGDVVDGVYAAPEAYGGLALLLVVVFYMFQIYYDFSGYSDIAVGAAKVLGYDLTWNFNRPYAARSVSDFWRRWHISLTTWFFDYIFYPINAALRSWGRWAVIVAITATFLVSGLWHGAQWTFVLFGLMHALALCIEYLTANQRRSLRRFVPPRLYAVSAWLVTFGFLTLVYILFRSPTVTQAWAIAWNMVGGLLPDLVFLAEAHFGLESLRTIFRVLPVTQLDLGIAIAAIVLVESVSWLGVRKPMRERLLDLPVVVRWAVYYGITGAIVFYGAHHDTTTFIYVRF